MKWTSRSMFIDIDTGEILKVTNERQLKYLNYIIVDKIKKITGDEKNKVIEYTNKCRHTGQREFTFE